MPVAVRQVPAGIVVEAKEALALTYGMITMIDDVIGRILARLTALGLDQNAIVIFTSDHGDFMGDHGLLLPLITGVEWIHREARGWVTTPVPALEDLPAETALLIEW